MAQAKKILVIEDEKILRDAYAQVLTKEGFTVYEAADGNEGIAIIKTVKPDLILLDIIMPHMDGLEFLRQANIMDISPHTKVIAFSNLSDQKKMDQMLRLGPIQHVLKSSLSPKQLAEKVRKLVY